MEEGEDGSDTDSLSNLDLSRSLRREDTNFELGLSGERPLSAEILI